MGEQITCLLGGMSGQAGGAEELVSGAPKRLQ